MKIKDYFKKAQKEGWAIGKFNFSTLEQLKAIFAAAANLKSPIILETSEGESNFIGIQEAVALVKLFSEKFKIPAFLNLDHGKSLEYIKEVVAFGYNLVHFDSSKLPLEENIKETKKVVDYCHKKGIFVEGEVGIVAGSSIIHKEKIEIREEDLTDSEEALKFVKETSVDSLAINIGTFHGVEADGMNPHINLQRLKEIREKTKDIPLILHGGSGTPEEDIKEAIKLGIVGININTELRAAFANALKKELQINSDEIVPYKFLPPAIEAVQRVVEKKIKLFGSNGKI